MSAFQGPLTQPYYEYYGPEHKLNLRMSIQAANANVQADLDRIKATVMEHLRELASAPGALYCEADVLFPPSLYVCKCRDRTMCTTAGNGEDCTRSYLRGKLALAIPRYWCYRYRVG